VSWRFKPERHRVYLPASFPGVVRYGPCHETDEREKQDGKAISNFFFNLVIHTFPPLSIPCPISPSFPLLSSPLYYDEYLLPYVKWRKSEGTKQGGGYAGSCWPRAQIDRGGPCGSPNRHQEKDDPKFQPRFQKRHFQYLPSSQPSWEGFVRKMVQGMVARGSSAERDVLLSYSNPSTPLSYHSGGGMQCDLIRQLPR
jgi:hypothetical protein